MGSNPGALKYFFFSFLFFDFLVCLYLFLILCTTGYIYLNLVCVYVTNNFDNLCTLNIFETADF